MSTAGDRGRTRDQLLLFFWPDSSQDRARHSLEQTLYRIRRSLGSSVFLGGNPLRLNPAVVTSDVGEFETAIGRGDLEPAVSLYRGPFLDGFYLGDAPEFEQWMVGERSRLDRLYAKALEELAKTAEAAGDSRAAVRWSRKLAESDPLSSRHALGYMRALAGAGDRAAALRHAREHEELLERELGTGAGPEIAALVDQIRAGSMNVPAPPRDLPRAAGEDRGASGESPQPKGGEVRQEAGIGAPGSSRGSRKRTVVEVAAALVLVVGALAGARLWRASDPPEPIATAHPSIAVLPLSNLSADPADSALADGMTEELIAMLAKVGDVRVIASTSAFAFRDRRTDVRTIADSLGVANILEGGVRRSGSRLRVQVRLVDARDGSTRWSEVYDREVEDLFDVQEEIARSVASELGSRFGGHVATPTSRNRARSVAAYELYLKGNDPVHLRSDSGPHKALEYFQQAIAIDSTYAAAWAGLSRMYARVVSPSSPGMPFEEMLRLSEEAALKAVALDDSVAEARATLGLLRGRQGQYAVAEAELRRAVELDPSYGRAREWLVRLYLDTERPVEALAEARRALDVDPLSPSAHAELAHALLANDRPDEALVHLGHIADVRPPLLRTKVLLAQAYVMKGMWAEALAASEFSEVSHDPDSRSFRGFVLARSGRRAEALRIRDELIEGWRAGEATSLDVAIVDVGLGDLDQAFAWIDRSIDDGSARSSYLDLTAPVFADLRDDPRFDRVRERLGIQKR